MKVVLKKIVQPKTIEIICKVIIFTIIPAVLFYLMEAYEHSAFEEVRIKAQWLNILLFELIAWFLFIIIGRAKWALSILTVVAMIYGLVNHYIMVFRSTPFVPWDIFSMGTAASVAGDYDFTPTKTVIWVTASFLVILVAIQFFKLRMPKKLWVRVIPTVCVGFLLCGFVGLLQNDSFQSKANLYPYLFTPAHMTKVNGMAVTFAMNLEYVIVDKPDGYSKSDAEEIINSYETQGEVDTENLPNVIVIMNEAFSDLAAIGDFTTNEDYMPFIHSLQQGYENTITGNTTVSIIGGNTCNSEFEFLTGHTMDFLPVGSIPFQQYIDGPTASLVSQFKDLGYAAYGMHPYGASGWKRDQVYPWLGFDVSMFKNDFWYKQYIRNYVSDKTAYDNLIRMFEEKEEGQPVFIFEVTMQNHGGYTDSFENFTPDIHVQEKDDAVLSMYLSLIKESDAQFKRLVEYFSKVEEDTIIVFFGDHQPNDFLANKLYKINGKTEITPEDAMKRYLTPYVIWANFDIEEGTNQDTDISLLSLKMLQQAGIPTTAYQNFLIEYVDVINNPNASQEEKDEMLLTYQKLQYYYLFE